jgi:hypothetical protein
MLLNTDVNSSDISVNDAVLINASVNSNITNSTATIDNGAVLIKTTLNSSNFNEFTQQQSSDSATLFDYDNKTITAYSGGLDRDGSVIIAGSNGGSIDSASNSVSIGGASVSTDNTVGVGTDMFVNGLFTVSSENNADVSGDIQVREDSTGDFFSVDSANSAQARYEGSEAFTFGARTGTVGEASVVFGGSSAISTLVNEASSDGALAAGLGTTASGVASVALGQLTTASADRSFAAGEGATASGLRSVAFGSNTTAAAESSFAAGNSSSVNGNFGFAVNSQTTAGGIHSFAANLGATASGLASSAFGSDTNADGESTIAAGEFSQASGDSSAAFGFETLSYPFGSAVFGAYNEDGGVITADISSLSESDHLFAVGVGDDDVGSGSDTFDNRGRKDGFYVTYRQGTFVRDALTALDNEGNAFFESALEVRSVYGQPTLTTTGNVSGGTTTAYAVVARDSDGNRTLLSLKNTIDLDNTALDGSNFVTVGWQGVPNATDYVVLKDPQNDGTWEELGTTTNTTFDDTGQTLSSFTVPTENETAVTAVDGLDVTLTENRQDTSGDLQIRDDSTGDLFSLDDGNTPPLSARYEGEFGSFTFGFRENNVGEGSLILGGLPSTFTVVSNPANSATALGAVAIGTGNSAGETSGFSPQGEFGITVGTNNTVEGDFGVSVGINNTVEKQFGVSIGGTENDPNTVGNQASDGDILIGNGLQTGVNQDTTFESPTVVVGNYNDDTQEQTRVPFIVGAGENDSNRNDAFRVAVSAVGGRGGGYVDTLWLNSSEAEFDRGWEQGEGFVIGSNPENNVNSQQGFDSIIMGSTTLNADSGSFSNSILYNTETEQTDAQTNREIGFIDAFAFNSRFETTDAFGDYDLSTDSFFVNTTITPSNQFKFSNIGTNTSFIDVFAVSGESLIVYEESGAVSRRAGSVSIAGGLIQEDSGGNVGPAQDSVAIGQNTVIDRANESIALAGATVSTDNTVGVGTDMFVNGVFTVSSENTANVSGDVQIRDDSTGDLFSLDDGSTPQLAAKYEGNAAFTFGKRDDTNVGTASFVVGGTTDAVSNAAAEVSGVASFAAGVQHDVSGRLSAAFGGSNLVSGESAFASGLSNEVLAESAQAFGDENDVSAVQASAFGSRNVNRVFTSFAVGVRAEETVTAGNEVSDVQSLSSGSRIFKVGVGDGPNTGTEEFDGRGRVDGLYVTYRNGTYVRHGLTVDAYDSGTSSYQRVSELLPNGGLELTGGIVRGSRNNVATNTSTSATDYFIGVDTSAGAFTVTLSTADATDGREIVIHDQAGNASGNSITVNTEGSETISGANYGTDLSSVDLTTDNESIVVRSDGTDWYII